ncbi:hypothetical protein [Methanothrix sp.]
MRRKRLTGMLCVKIGPKIKEQIARVSDSRELTLSELARAYIEEGLARDGVTC